MHSFNCNKKKSYAKSEFSDEMLLLGITKNIYLPILNKFSSKALL